MYQVPDMTGRTAVVTGASSGLGLETARRLAGAGAHVVMAVRDPDKGKAAMEQITEDLPGARVELGIVDLADLSSVRAFAERLSREPAGLDLLVNNAGVMAVPQRTTTVDGHELQWQTNFLGPFALTNLLLPVLLRAEAPRVSTMSSGMANRGRIRFADPDAENRRYGAAGAYAQSKLADLYLALHLAELATDRGWPLMSNAAHPGFTRTNLQAAGPNLGRERPRWTPLAGSPALPSMDPPQGAGPILFAATSPQAEPGGYYGPTGRFGLVGEVGPAPLNARMADAMAATRTWRLAERLTGTAPPA